MALQPQRRGFLQAMFEKLLRLVEVLCDEQYQAPLDKTFLRTHKQLIRNLILNELGIYKAGEGLCDLHPNWYEIELSTNSKLLGILLLNI